jgi:glycosyltransferase involved in cell wall biosynthesis
MKVCLDARWIFAEISGVGAYTRSLIRELTLLDRANTYVLLFQNMELVERTARETGFREAPNVSTHVVPYGVFSIRNQLYLPAWLRQNRVDVFHSTNFMLPMLAFPRHRSRTVRAVVTIHDVIPMIFRDHAPRSRKSRVYPLYAGIMREIGARADAIITVSEASRRDIIRHLNIPMHEQEKVTAIHNGVAPTFHETPARHRERGPKDMRTILYVGRADPYKNLGMLLRAFARCRTTVPFPLQLVLAGSPDPRYPEPHALAEELGIADAVRWTGYLTHEQLVDQYRSADVLAHPSRYEGFGLQLVEAMACGVPVVCTMGGSQPEIAGDAALVVPVDNEQAFADAVSNVLRSPELADTLREKGIKRAAVFTWEETARKTVRVYSNVAAKGRQQTCP